MSLYSSITFLINYFPFVLLRMPIRSTMKGDSFSSSHTWRKLFIRDKKYSTRWIFVSRVTSDEKLTKITVIIIIIINSNDLC